MFLIKATNNAVEADGNDIQISLNQSVNNAIITITDNGCGIPSYLLDKLGQKGFTFGKQQGSGLGLYHAITTIQSWKGSFKVDSSIGNGTTITIHLPLSIPPSWLVKILKIFINSQIIIVDDDINAHQIWSYRFKKLNTEHFNLSFFHFPTLEKLKEFTTNEPLRPRVFLIDYEFSGVEKNGLETIERLKIQSESILVTNHNEESLYFRCQKLGIKIIPKELVPYVPIVFEAAR
ncbi:MAG: ATP-binding protein [Pseudomonadota bacterium]